MAWHPPAEKHVIVADRFDHGVIDGVVEESPNLTGYRDTLADDFAHTDALMRDLGAVFFQAEPTMRGSNETDPRVAPSRSLVQCALESPDTESLRQYTVYDRWSTAMAMSGLAEALAPHMDRLREEMKAAEQRAQQMEEAAEQGQAADEAGDEAGATAARQQMETLGQQNDEAAEALRAALSQATREAISTAAQEADGEAEAMRGFGIDPAEVKEMDYAEREELAKALRTNRMAKFARLFGRARMTALSEYARRTEHGRDEAYSVTLSSNAADMLPREILALTSSVPVIRQSALMRLAQGRLLARKWRGVQRSGEGPIVMVLDESGSMEAPDGYRGPYREQWAKAFALALMTVAEKQGRPFACVKFSLETRVVRGSDWRARLDVAGTFLNGGTDWELALTTGMQQVVNGGEFTKADLVFVTDGECAVSDAWVKAFRSACTDSGLRVWGVAVGDDIDPVAMRPICDDIRHITAYTDQQGVTDLLRAV